MSMRTHVRRPRILIALALLLVAPLAAGMSSPGGGGGSAVKYLVGFHTVPAGLDPGDPLYGGTVRSVNQLLEFASVVTSDPARLLAETRLDANVRYAHEDQPRLMVAPFSGENPSGGDAAPGAFIPNDPLFASQYGPVQVRAPQAWATTRGDADANLCVTDTGIRYTHEDLAGPRYQGGIDLWDDDNDPWDEYTIFGVPIGHGTHVTGIAAATINNLKGIAGMAQVNFYMVKISGPQGFSDWETMAEAYVWCADNTPARTVVSTSFGGGGGAPVVADAVRYAYNDRGKLLVASAGNNGPCFDCIGYPAAYPEVIAVPCTSNGETPCWFTSQGPQAEIAAPGDNIISSTNGGDNTYLPLSGTSMSAPHVSGAAALAWSYHTALTAAQLRARLRATAQDLGTPGFDEVSGYGELDVKCLLDGTSPCLGV